jgi:hypothetical protein
VFIPRPAVKPGEVFYAQKFCNIKNNVYLFALRDLEPLLQPEGMECGVAMIRGGYNRESSERHDACINGRVAFEVEHSSMQGLKKREKSFGSLLIYS